MPRRSMLTPLQQNWLKFGILLTLALVWGSSFMLMKKAQLVFSPLQVGLLRMGIAGLALLPLSLRYLYRARNKSGYPWGWLVMASITGNMGPAIFFSLAIANTQSSALVGIMNATTPLFTLVVGALFFAAPIGRWRFSGIALGLLGAALLVVLSQGTPQMPDIYILLIPLATFCYGLNLNLIKYKLSGLKSMEIASIALGFAMLPAWVIFLLFTEQPQGWMGSPTGWEALGYLTLLGVVGTALALLLFFGMLKFASPLFASSVTYLIPIVAMIWGVVDGELLTRYHLLGLGAILLGVALVNRGEQLTRRANRQAADSAAESNPAKKPSPATQPSEPNTSEQQAEPVQAGQPSGRLGLRTAFRKND